MSLAQLRTGIADTLTAAGLEGFDHLPGRLPVPSAIVAAGTPYIEPGPTFGSFTGRYDVVLVGSPGDNEKATDDLDEQLETALKALVGEQYGIEQVSAPYALEANNATYPAVRITITEPFKL